MPDHRTKSLALVLASVTLTLAAALSLYGQQDVGRITGTVHDPSGAVIPNASVAARLTSMGTQLQALTNASGIYVFPALHIGEYDLSVQVSGFKTAVRTGVRVIASVTVTEDFTLELGLATQSVSVTATPTVL